MAIVAAVAVIVGLMGITTLQGYKHVVDDMGRVSKSAVLGERVNGLILAVFVVSRKIVRPLVKMTGVMKALAAGDYAATVPCTAAKDEIGTMAAAVQVFKDNGLTPLVQAA
jgi:HAMP domain-containing protein